MLLAVLLSQLASHVPCTRRSEIHVPASFGLQSPIVSTVSWLVCSNTKENMNSKKSGAVVERPEEAFLGIGRYHVPSADHCSICLSLWQHGTCIINLGCVIFHNLHIHHVSANAGLRIPPPSDHIDQTRSHHSCTCLRSIRSDKGRLVI